MYFLTATQVKLDSFRIPSAMSDSKSWTTSMLEVTISSNTERVFIRDLSNPSLKIIFDA